MPRKLNALPDAQPQTHDTPPALPPLTERQSSLLSAFITARGDLAAVLASSNIPAPELLEWSQSQAVQAHLLALKALSATALDYRASQSRTAALNKLESLLTSADPIEQRRAANSIAAVASERRGTSSRSTQHSALSTSRDSGPRTPDLPLTRDFPPTYTPTPSLSPDHLADLIASAMQTPKDKTALSAIRAFLHPDATFFERPAFPNHDAFLDRTATLFEFVGPVSATTIRPISRSTDSSAFSYRLTVYSSMQSHPFSLTLSKDPRPDSPHPNCWLITDLTFA